MAKIAGGFCHPRHGTIGTLAPLEGVRTIRPNARERMAGGEDSGWGQPSARAKCASSAARESPRPEAMGALRRRKRRGLEARG